jgi:FixJ family two-component response regulator
MAALFQEGLLNKQIAYALGVSEATIKARMAHERPLRPESGRQIGVLESIETGQ